MSKQSLIQVGESIKNKLSSLRIAPRTNNKIFVAVFMAFLMISMVSAWDWDNSKEYDKNSNTITITNAFGLGEELFKAQLITPQNYQVIDRGNVNQLVAEIEFKNFKSNYNKALKKIDLYSINHNDAFFRRDIEYRYREYLRTDKTPRYANECTGTGNYNSNGTETQSCKSVKVRTDSREVYSDWITFTDVSELPNKVVRIGLFTDVREGDNVEWIPTWFGVEIDEWASWTSNFNIGNFAYYKLDDATGNVSDATGNGYNGFNQSAVRGMNGKIVNASYYDGVLGYINITAALTLDAFTINAWVSANSSSDDWAGIFTATNIIRIRKQAALNTINIAVDGCPGNEITSVATIFDASWHMITLIHNSSNNNFSFYVDGVYDNQVSNICVSPVSITKIELGRGFSGNTESYQGRIDEVGLWNRSITDSELSDLYNGGAGIGFKAAGASIVLTTTLNSPPDNLRTTNSSLRFNANQLVTDGDLKNTTLYVWYSNKTLFGTNFTTITGTSNATNLSVSGLVAGNNYDWNFETCADNVTSTLCEFAASNRSFDMPFAETSFSFNRTGIYETSNQYYELNMTTVSNVLSVTAKFYYNGTIYNSDVSCTLPACTVSNTIDVPLVLNGMSSQNKSFFWNVTSVFSDRSSSSASTSNEQNISKLLIAPCNDTVSTTFVNFTSYSAINPNPAVNMTFKATWFYWLGGGDTRRNNSYENLTEVSNEFKYCARPNKTLVTTAEFEFDATGYSQNNHYYYKKNISNTVLEQFFYVLNDSSSTLTTINVVNALQQGLPDHIAEIYLFDVGTGEEKIVSMAKTDHNGEDIVYLNWFDSFYKFRIYSQGVLLSTVDPYKVGATPQTFTIDIGESFEQDKFDDLIWTLTYNDATKEFVLIYEDPNEAIDGGCLRVVRGSAYNYTTLYDECLSATSGTLSYTLGNTTGTFLAVFYAKGSFDVLDTLLQYIAALENIYDTIGNLDATTMALILVGTATMVGVMISGVLGILMLLVGYALAMAIGFQSPEFFMEFVALAIMGGMVMYYLRK